MEKNEVKSSLTIEQIKSVKDALGEPALIGSEGRVIENAVLPDNTSVVSANIYTAMLHDLFKVGDFVEVDKAQGTIVSITGTVCEVDLGWSSTQTKPLRDCKKITKP